MSNIGTRLRRFAAGAASTSLVAVSLLGASEPALAAVTPDAGVIINEVYGGGGNARAPLSNDFVELANTSDTAIDLNGWSLQYASSAGTNWNNSIDLSGTIEPDSLFLVEAAAGANTDATPLPTPDVVGSIAMSASKGNVALVNSVDPLTCEKTDCANDDAVIDLVGYGAADAFAGTGPAPAPSNEKSVARTDLANTADNAADFTAGDPTPTNSLGETAGEDPDPEPTDPDPTSTGPVPDPLLLEIADIQGAGSESPELGNTVRAQGVVTAAYPTGGIDGFVIQTAGSGADYDAASHEASDAIFVYSKADVAIGDHVDVTGEVAEFYGLTQLVPKNAADVVQLDEPAQAIKAIETTWPTTDAEREALESMLIMPDGDFTVTNTFSTNQYGEVGLASGTKPLIQPTDVARPGQGADDIAADNAERAVALDDGATTNFTRDENTDQTPPYVSLDNPVRVGEKANFTEPVIVDYRNDTWKLNPTQQVLPGEETVTFDNSRTVAPDAAALGDGDLQLASFNVLNYFTTLGADLQGCTSYKDRDGNPITVNRCPGKGPRGAWDDASLQRQQAKIVAAINATDADVTGLMEIENSAVLGAPVDEALSTLVAALNADAGSDKWAVVPSSSDLPDLALQDVITNGIIYQPAMVSMVGDPVALGDQSGDGQAFVNAREPIGQVFEPVDGGEKFFTVVNHFKSKGSAGPAAGDEDSGDGQAASNGSRKLQAAALRDWIPDVQAAADVDAVALIGDFNSYTAEDPLQILYDAGYVNATSAFDMDKYSYSYSGLSGSLDHVLLNQNFLDRSTGADIWNINAPESIALEYSRYNAHGTLFYDESPYRASDHDPVIIGFNSGQTAAGSVEINLVNINDFHGRIDKNTVKFAGTVEEARAAVGDDNTLFMAAGDNFGASVFASAVQQDNPTIDVLNALDMAVAGVGNHEFDKGYDDLVGRVADRANFNYLGANVYEKGTQNAALDEYQVFEIDGVTVGVIGAVTQETPTLVTPGGIADLDFGDPVEAVNRVAAQLSDGDESNGEADIIVAEYHEGANKGIPDDATLESQVEASEAFASIVNDTSAEVDAIFTGHTHVPYVWDGPIADSDATRPIIQTGSYGSFVGQAVLTVDTDSDEVESYTSQLIPRTSEDDDALAAQFPRVAEVQQIVNDALAEAAVIGDVVVGSVTADITTAFKNGERDDRGSESTLGNLVANSLRASLADPNTGGADIGVVNPGGLRADLLYAKSGAETEDGQVTYGEANAVLPFVNNLWTTTLTGAQFKTLLEQQWQTDENGDVPSRDYLQLGLSDNVSYTFADDRDQGDHITSITINGEPYDPEADYRMGTFSFLAQGGDNFRVFNEGTDTRDSGLIDRDAWIEYLTDNQDLAPDFARHAVRVANLPETTDVGSELAIDVSGLDLTSLGAPANTELAATFFGPDLAEDGVPFGTVSVTDGAATVSGTVPQAAAGATELRLVADPSGTTAHLWLTVSDDPGAEVTETTTTLEVSGTLKVNKPITLLATVDPADAAGTFEFRDGDTVLGTVVAGGGAGGIVTQALSAGKHSLTATFIPADSTAFSESTSDVVKVKVKDAQVKKVHPKVKTSITHWGKKVKVNVSAKGETPTGEVTVRVDGKKVKTAELNNGKVTLKIPKQRWGLRIYQISYSGSDTVHSKTVHQLVLVL